MHAKKLPIYVLFGGLFGVLIGLLSPTLSSIIAPVGDIYIRLMEVVVLPYLISSLVLGLGQLAPQTALKLFKNSWLIYLTLWAATFLVVFVAASTVPLVQQAAVINYSEALQPSTNGGSSLIDLLVPDNIFQALNKNYIPSIVLIGIIFGLAVQHADKRSEFLNFLSVIQRSCVRIWSWVVFLAPIGVCALFAGTINTMNPAGYAAMSIYVVVVMLSALLLGLWVLPMLLTAFLPLRYWEIMAALKEAFLISIVTSLSVASLPMIQTAAQNMAKKHIAGGNEAQQKEIIQTTLSVSYPLAQVGNFFILAFLLYASFYFFIPVPISELLELPGVTLLSGMGSPTSSIGAVNFMAGWLGMPDETTNLYVETMAATRYAQVLASVAAFAFVTILVTFSFYGHFRFDLRRFAATVIVAVVCLSGIWSIGRLGGNHIQLHSETNYLAMGLPSQLQTLSDANLVVDTASTVSASASAPGEPSSATTISDKSAVLPGSGGILGRIQSEGVLRVGVNANVMPFAFENDDGRLVGYDIEMMYRLAQSMNVKLAFVPYSWQSMTEDLRNFKFDIAVGGLYITNERLRTVTVSNPYYENPLALIVRTDDIANYASRDQIDAIRDLNIAVFDDPVLIPQAKRSFPAAQIKILANYDRLADEADIDAAIWTLEQARAWAISHDGYSAVVPKDMASRFLFGYLMPPGSIGLSDYFNFWMDQQKDNGVLAEMAKRWIDPATVQSPL
ncbi:MAG: cation:dicarboxylase symporter family transporter [Alphaproteobacteria bacterium]|nr:cation:dicarboxylase symporter family transporter [Alphaproteobacteria bacterium]